MKLVCPNIVIGGCISSVVYAIQNNYHLVCDPHLKPFKFEKLSGFNLQGEWSNLLTNMSLGGLVLNSRSIESIRIKASQCTVVEQGASRFSIDFDKCFVFDTKKLNCENEIKKHHSQLYKVYDWIDTRSCSFHELSHIKSRDRFVGELYFYETDRITGRTNVKDIVSISYLSKEQLNDFNYSDTMAMFKVISILEKHGVKGPRSGYQKSGKIKRGSIKLEPRNRDVVLVSENEYRNSKKIKFLNLRRKKDNILLSYVGTRIK